MALCPLAVDESDSEVAAPICLWLPRISSSVFRTLLSGAVLFVSDRPQHLWMTVACVGRNPLCAVIERHYHEAMKIARVILRDGASGLSPVSPAIISGSPSVARGSGEDVRFRTTKDLEVQLFTKCYAALYLGSRTAVRFLRPRAYALRSIGGHNAVYRD
jgi:hypothetical protein